jgi:hypothetical protein
MTPRFPKNRGLRLEALMFSLIKTFRKLPGKENLPPEMVLSAIANAAAMFAAGHGIDVARYIELQGAMNMMKTDEKKDPKA